MNIELRNSSILCGFAILILVVCFHSTTHPEYNLLYAITIFAIGTSVLNHGLSNGYIKILDRSTIVLSVLLYAYYIYLLSDDFTKTFAFSLLGVMVMAFFYSKLYARSRRQTFSHMISHFLSVLLFGTIVYSVWLNSRCVVFTE